MKKFKQYALLLLAAVVVFGCSKYDDTELRNDVSDLQSRVEKLEKWCETTNTQISALQGIVTALEAKDYVTGVSPIIEGSETVGYTITFSKSSAVTIKNGANGKDGLNGVPPIIGVAKHTDGLYYWTVKTGEADAAWMRDADDNMIRTTGDKGTDGSIGADGKTPVLSVATDTDSKVYWKVNGEWMLMDGKKVQATGDKGDKGETGAAGAAGKDGDSIFKKDGIDLTDPNNVTFTLADGTSKITFPRTGAVKVFDSFDNFKIATLDAVTDLTLALNIKDADYKAIKAELTSSAGLSTAIKTRAAAAPWEVAITAPTFQADGTINAQPVVSITAKDAAEGDIALLKVTVIDSKGDEHASTRVLLYSTKVDVESVTIDETLALNINEEQSLTVNVLPAGATQTVAWTSSDATIAAVDADGKVKGIKAGTAMIKAASTDDSAKFDECTVTVSTVDVTGVTLGGDKTVPVGGKVTLVATVLPANATIKTVTWSSDNANIATVNATTGEVEGKTLGEATITAISTANITIKATCKVTVTDAPQIEWATGNLVADGANGAKIGTPTDKGLYFQFGSLIGWGDASTPTIAIKPAAFNGNEDWADKGKVWQGTEGVVPFTAAGSNEEKAGIGDPCRYYLGSTWRLPKKEEYIKLFENNGWPTIGPWVWDNSSKSAINNTTGLVFPASGTFHSLGILQSVGTTGSYGNASPVDANRASYTMFFNTILSPNNVNSRLSGLSVRCVCELD